MTLFSQVLMGIILFPVLWTRQTNDMRFTWQSRKQESNHERSHLRDRPGRKPGPMSPSIQLLHRLSIPAPFFLHFDVHQTPLSDCSSSR
jgi:hypothetical protein